MAIIVIVTLAVYSVHCTVTCIVHSDSDVYSGRDVNSNSGVYSVY